MDWSHLTQELPFETCYCRTDRRAEQKWLEDEEEDVSSYWMPLRKQEGTGNWKSKHEIAHHRELNLEEA